MHAQLIYGEMKTGVNYFGCSECHQWRSKEDLSPRFVVAMTFNSNRLLLNRACAVNNDRIPRN